MWMDPRTWYFPFSGSPHSSHSSEYSSHIFRMQSVTDLNKFSVGFWQASLFSMHYSEKTLNKKFRRIWSGLPGLVVLIFLLLTGTAIGFGLAPSGGTLFDTYQLVKWVEPAEFVIGGIVFILCMILLWHIRSEMNESKK